MLLAQEVVIPNDGQNLNVKQKVEGEQMSSIPVDVSQKLSSSQSNIDKKWELEKQLHEQYAINNNEHTSSFITFVIALFALFGILGYAFAKTPSSPDNENIIRNFLILAPFVSGILLFLASLCVQIGYAQRRDQVIIEKFRKEYGLEIYNSATGKKYWEFLPDYYNLFFWLFFTAQIVVILLTIIKYCDCIDMCSCFTLSLSCLLQIVAAGMLFGIRCCFYRKYKAFCSDKEKK